MGSFSARHHEVLRGFTLVLGLLFAPALSLFSSPALAVDVDGDGLNHIVDPNDYKHRYHLSTSVVHTCLLEDHGVNCWGSNMAGASAPPDLVNPTEVAVGEDFSCAVDAEGQVHCWGRNDVGQAAGGPLDVRLRGLAAGSRHACAIAYEWDASLWCWGEVPPNQPDITGVLSVQAGESHTCALNAEGLHCWGDPGSGQVPATFEATPQYAVGLMHTCAIDASGEVQCWGRDLEGQASPPPLSNPRLIAAGGFLSCAVDDNGVQCWGQTMSGIPLPAAPALNNVYQLDVGFEHVCALSDEGLTCWAAEGSWGDSLGVAMTTELYQADQVLRADGQTCVRSQGKIQCFGSRAVPLPAMTNPSLIGATMESICADADEGFFCWGKDTDLDIWMEGDGFVSAAFASRGMAAIHTYFGAPSLDIMATPSLTYTNWILPSDLMLDHPSRAWLGESGACARDLNGLHCWNSVGSLALPITDAAEVAISSQAMCAVAAGEIHCWTDDPTTSADWQASAPPMTGVTELVASDFYSFSFFCARNPDGVQCWNAYEDLAYLVPPLQNPVALFAGRNLVCAIDDTGLVCWGDVDNTTPPQPVTGVTAVHIRNDLPDTCTVGSDGLVCWGMSGYTLKQAFFEHLPTFDDSDGDTAPDDIDGEPFDPLKTTPNTTPVATLGGGNITLVGSGIAYLWAYDSYDSDGDELQYAWDFDTSDGVSFEPADATGASAETNYGSPGEYTVTLQVTDSSGATATDSALVTIIADTDGDLVPDADDAFPSSASASIDTDGDGFPDDCSSPQACLDDGLPPDPSLNDFDNDGIPASEDTDDTADTAPPSVIAPGDIDLVATGPETDVDLFTASTAYASDFPDAVLTALPDTAGHTSSLALPSGRNLINWCATDAAGNTGCATQTVNITPLVSFVSEAQTTAEGVSVDVLVSLSGDPIAYPVTVPLVVDSAVGTAVNPDDHDAVDAILVIEVDDPEDDLPVNTARYRFTTLDDGVTGEVDETVVVKLVETNGTDTLTGAALGELTSATHTVIITEKNVAPVVTLISPDSVPAAEKTAEVSVEITDPNQHSKYLVTWYLDDVLVETGTNLTDILVDLEDLDAGVHTLRVTVLDTGSPAKEGTAEQEIDVRAAPRSSGGGSPSPVLLVAIITLAGLRKRGLWAEAH